MDNESELHDCNDCRLEEPMLPPKLLLLLVLCKIFMLAFLIKSVVSKISDLVEIIEDWDKRGNSESACFEKGYFM